MFCAFWRGIAITLSALSTDVFDDVMQYLLHLCTVLVIYCYLSSDLLLLVLRLIIAAESV